MDLETLRPRVTSKLARTPNLLHALAAARKYRSHTMLSPARAIDNLLIAMRETPPDGDVVECGVWRGGMIRALADVLGPEREYHLFDSFEGLPPAQEIDGEGALAYQRDRSSAYYLDNCKADESYARSLFGGGDRTAAFHRGWFSDTIPDFRPARPIALLRLDADWYDSTLTCLRGLTPHLAPGALIVVDDYYAWDGCARAVHQYLSERDSSARINKSLLGTCYIKWSS